MWAMIVENRFIRTSGETFSTDNYSSQYRCLHCIVTIVFQSVFRSYARDIYTGRVRNVRENRSCIREKINRRRNFQFQQRAGLLRLLLKNNMHEKINTSRLII